MSEPQPLTPDGPPFDEAGRIRNLVAQFRDGLHRLDEMPGLILATLDAERARPDAGLREATATELLDAVDAALDPSLVRHADRRARAMSRLREAYNAVVEEANR